MTERASASIGAVVAVTAFLLAAGVLHARDGLGSADEEAHRMLYVRSGALASRLYLSFDAIASDLLNGIPSCTCHSDKTAVSAPAAIAGIRSRVAMSGLQDFGQLRGDFLGLGDGGAFEHLADAG